MLAAVATLDREIAADVQAHGIPGLAITIIHGHDTLWHHDYGLADLARGEKIGPATRFRLGSMSKLLTGLAIVQLRDAGKLDLDDRATRFLPWFRLSGDEHPAITIRELLLHLSGLPADAPGVSWTDRVMPTREQVIQGLPEVAPVLPAETTWKYSNLGYVLLGLVIEAASGQPYADYIGAHVLAPLGMAETLVEPGPESPHLAIGYGARGAGRPPRTARLPGHGRHDPGGRHHCDRQRHGQARCLGARGERRPGACRRSAAARCCASMPITRISRAARASAGRSSPPARACASAMPARPRASPASSRSSPATGLGVAVLINADENGPGKIADRALDLLGPAVAAATPLPPAATADPAWLDYIGTYGADHRDCAIVIANGRLAWQDPAAADPARTRIYLDPAGKDRFKWAGGNLKGELVVFERDAAGQVARMLEGGYYDVRR